jgi:DNA-binding NtrC family response regulator
MYEISLDGCDVLLVEDEPLVMLDIKCALEETGARVDCARSLSEARALVKVEKVVAAVVDYVLADGTADDLCSELKQRDIPFAVYSGYQQLDGSCSRGEVLSKPARPDDLVALVLHIFASKSLRARC